MLVQHGSRGRGSGALHRSLRPHRGKLPSNWFLTGIHPSLLQHQGPFSVSSDFGLVALFHPPANARQLRLSRGPKHSPNGPGHQDAGQSRSGGRAANPDNHTRLVTAPRHSFRHGNALSLRTTTSKPASGAMARITSPTWVSVGALMTLSVSLRLGTPASASKARAQSQPKH